MDVIYRLLSELNAIHGYGRQKGLSPQAIQGKLLAKLQPSEKILRLGMPRISDFTIEQLQTALYDMETTIMVEQSTNLEGAKCGLYNAIANPIPYCASSRTPQQVRGQYRKEKGAYAFWVKA